MSKNGLLAFITFMFMICLCVLGIISHSVDEPYVMWCILPLSGLIWILFLLVCDKVD